MFQDLVHFLSTYETEIARLGPSEPEPALRMNKAEIHVKRGICRRSLEARGGIEPPNKGFADLCLTTWLPRHTWKRSLDLNLSSQPCHSQ